MHPALVKKHKEKLKCVFDYDEIFIDKFNTTKTIYYDLMEDLTKSLKKDVDYIFI